MYWIKLFLTQRELCKEMREYVAWRSLRYPTTTESHREWLYKFAVHHGKRTVRFIDAEDVKTFISGLSSEYAKLEASKAIHNFLAFHGVGDLYAVQENAILSVMKKIGRPADMAHIRQVKKLKNVDRLSFRRIQQELEKKEGKIYHVSQLHAWYHYPVKAVQETPVV